MSSDPENPGNALDQIDQDNDGEEDELGTENITTGAIVPDEVVEESKEVKKRVKALKKIQVEIAKIEARFYAEMHALECKYLPTYMPHFELRRKILLGDYEPTEEECDFVLGSDCEDNGDNEEKDKLEAGDTNLTKEKVTGIPNFWLTIFQNVEMLQELTLEHDVPILEHLTDITVEMTEDPMGFTLEFHFSPNEYFSNTKLTKSYEMKCEVDPEDPFSFEGPEIIKCKGCPIDWAKGKNVTVQTVKKRQKHKQLGSIRTVSKTVAAPSFFNFFSPPQIPEGADADVDEETQIRLTNDFEIGQYIRERIVPRAVLYYTGEALEDDYEEEEVEEEEEDDDEEEDDEEKSPPVDSRSRARNFGRKNQSSALKNPECNQQ